MLAILLLNEGSMITLVVVLLRFALLAASGATLLLTLNPRYAWVRLVGVLVAGGLVLVAYGFLDDRPYYADPNGRYVVMALCVPVAVGFLAVGWYALRARSGR